MPERPSHPDHPNGVEPSGSAGSRRRGAAAVTPIERERWRPEDPHAWEHAQPSEEGAGSRPPGPPVRLRRTKDHRSQFRAARRRWRLWPGRRPSPHPIRRAVVWSLILVAVALGAAVAHAYYQAYQIYSGVSGVVPILDSARHQLSQGILPENNPTGEALLLADTAQYQLDHAAWTLKLTGALPLLDRPILAVRKGVDAAREESLGGQALQGIATDVLGSALATRSGTTGPDGPPPIYADGKVNVQLLESLSPRLEAALQHMENADRAIRAIPPIPFVAGLTEQKAAALAASTDAIRQVRAALAAVKVLPGFFGVQGERTYFLALVNNAEARSNGGALLAYAFVTVRDGTLNLGLTGGIVPSPIGRMQTYRTPDFPRVASAWRRVLADRGYPVDGIIQIDPYAVADILGNEEIRVADFPNPITAQNLPRVVEFDQNFLPVRQQKLLPGELVQAAWRILQQPVRFLPLLKTLSGQIESKHLLMWSRQADEEALIDQLRWAGRVSVTPGDYVFPGQDMLVGHKVGFFTQTAMAYDVRVLDSGDLDVTCRVTLTNQTPPGLPGRIALVTENGYADQQTLVGLRLPRSAKILGRARAGDPPTQIEGDALVVARLVQVTAGESDTATWHWRVPHGVLDSSEGSVYQLTIQHQAMANPASLVVHVTFPAGSHPEVPDLWTLDGRTASFSTTLVKDWSWQMPF